MFDRSECELLSVGVRCELDEHVNVVQRMVDRAVDGDVDRIATERHTEILPGGAAGYRPLEPNLIPGWLRAPSTMARPAQPVAPVMARLMVGMTSDHRTVRVGGSRGSVTPAPAQERAGNRRETVISPADGHHTF